MNDLKLQIALDSIKTLAENSADYSREMIRNTDNQDTRALYTGALGAWETLLQHLDRCDYIKVEVKSAEGDTTCH